MGDIKLINEKVCIYNLARVIDNNTLENMEGVMSYPPFCYKYVAVSMTTIDMRTMLKGDSIKVIKNDSKPGNTEKDIIEKFVNYAINRQFQIVGTDGSKLGDRLTQRAMVCGANIGNLTNVPLKPWEGAEFTSKFSNYNINLEEVFGVRGDDFDKFSSLLGIRPQSMAEISAIYYRKLTKIGEKGDLTEFNPRHIVKNVSEIIELNRKRVDQLTDMYLRWLESSHYFTASKRKNLRDAVMETKPV